MHEREMKDRFEKLEFENMWVKHEWIEVKKARAANESVRNVLYSISPMLEISSSISTDCAAQICPFCMEHYNVKETNLNIYLSQFKLLCEDYELPAKEWGWALAVSQKSEALSVYLQLLKVYKLASIANQYTAARSATC